MGVTAEPDLVAGGSELIVVGMTCQGCVNAVSRALSRVAGVTGVAVDLATGRVRAAGTASTASLAAAVEKAGFAVEAPGDEGNDDGHRGLAGD